MGEMKKPLPFGLKPEDIKLHDPFKDPEQEPFYTKHFLPSVSMGCAVPKQVCPVCEAGHEPKFMAPQSPSSDLVNFDFAFLEKRIMAAMGVPKEFFTHDSMTVEESDEEFKARLIKQGSPSDPAYQVPEEGDRMIGIDFGANDEAVFVTGVVKRLGEPNKNGDVFELESFHPVPRKLHPVRMLPPVHRDAQPVNKTAARIKALTDSYAETVRNDPHHVPQVPPGYGTPLIQEVIKLQMQIDLIQKSFFPMYALKIPEDLPPAELQKVREFFNQVEKDPTKIPIMPEGVKLEPVETAEQKVQKHPAVLDIAAAQEHAAAQYKEAEAWGNKRDMMLWGDRIYQLYRERQRVEARLFQQMRADMDDQLQEIYGSPPKEKAYDPPPSSRPACIRSRADFNIEHEECELCSHLQECSYHACKEPKCAKCGCSMVLHQAKHGPMEGDWFWGCSNFPECRGTRTHNEVLGIYTGLHSIDVEERKKGWIGFEAYDEYKQELIYGRSFKASQISGTLLRDEFVEPCTRAFNLKPRDILEKLFEALGLPFDGRYLVKGPGMLSFDVNSAALEMALRSSPVLRRMEGTKAHNEQTVSRVTFETNGTFFELRLKSKSGQTICGARFTPDEGHLSGDQIRDYLLTPFVKRAKEKTTYENEESILRLTATGLLQHPNPIAEFVLECVEDILQANYPGNGVIHASMVAAAKKAGKAMSSVAGKLDRYFKPKGTVTGRFPAKNFRDQVKNVPYPRSGAMNEAFRRNYNAPPPQSGASDIAALMERSWSQGTEDFIKRQQAERPRKLVEAEIARHEEAIKETKMAETTTQFTPGTCKCGAVGGCMCPREEESKLEKACVHSFLVLVRPEIAKEMGVDLDAIVEQMKKPDEEWKTGGKEHAISQLRLYACRECLQIFAPFDTTQPIAYVPTTFSF